VVCVDSPELRSKGLVDFAGDIWILPVPLGFEVGKELEPGIVPSVVDRKGAKGNAVASSLGPLPLITFFGGLSDPERDCICSFSDTPSTNSDSSFSVELVSASVNSSTKPCAWA